jgi:hypothetical protein
MTRSGANLAGIVLTDIDQNYDNSYYHRYGYGFSRSDARHLDN